MERVRSAGVLPRSMGEQVRGALERGAVVVTGNERTARTLRRAYDAEMAAGGRLRWEPAAVLSWSSWTGALWRRLLIGGRTRSLLLNAEQEHAVWRAVLAGDTESASLRGLDGLAEMAAESWARMWAYAEMSRSRSGRERLFGRLSDGSGGTDTAAFARWVRAFAERCQADRLLTGAELDAVLAGEVEAGELGVAEREIRLVGFDGLLPRQERLVAALGRAGVDVAHVEAGVAGAQVRLLGAADEGEELRACARWAARWLGTKGDVRIGVIVPDLQAERAGMERVFREVLAPELESILADEATAPFEFSLGRPLTETALSAVAMELLRWGAGALRVGRVSALLVSRYFAGGGEREARAEFDVADLRRAEMLRPELTLAEMARQVAGSRRSGRLPELLGAVRRMQRLAASFDGVAQSHGSWAGAMRELLAAGGWGAGGAGETSVEFQVRERWEGALDGLATLDFESRAVDYAEALGAMERIAHGTIFAPESRSAPVQVMGPLEAAGSEFDAVWLMRAGELSWPAEARPLPLLPWSLQRDLRMPGTDAERDLAAARAMTDRILASAGEVVVSYARATGETEQRASALVRSRVQGEAAIGDVAGGEPGREVVGMEWAEDAGRLRALPEGAVSGGVRVLELQAACGFRAFAEQRLGSGVIESQALGLSAKQSGTAVHRALESFWGEVRTQADLRAMTREQRGAALLRAIDAGLASSERRAGDRLETSAWDRAYLDVQRERMRRLLEGWLQVEMRRAPFAVLESEKRVQDVRVGPLLFDLRLDRVDEVDGARVLIDYKTGGAETKEWTGDRPDAPQVPLYAILAAGTDAPAVAGDEGAEQSELGAVAFARVKAGKNAALLGFAAREGLLPGRLPRMDAKTFGEQVELWGEVMERLATEFAAGDAAVRPKIYPGTCLRCGQRALCRLDASLLEVADEEEFGEGEDG